VQISSWQQRYDTLKKGNAREISDLRRDNKRVEHENQRLKLVNEKRQQVIHRKMKEADEAKKRLAVIERRQRLRRPAAPSRTGAGAGPSALHTAPAGPMVGTAHVLHSVPVGPPTAALGDASPRSGPHSVSGLSGPLPVTGQLQSQSERVRPLRPNADAPELHTAKAMEEWIREELDAASTAHDTRVVLEGTLAKRGEIKQAADKLKAEVAYIDNLPEDERVRPTSSRP
jgi:hypothetical protein